MTDPALPQAELMNATYRHQRWIYDASRKYFLFGRDHLIRQLDPPRAAHVLEVACGTGRNLQLIRRKHPDAILYGLDISTEMLRSARAKLPDDVKLAPADACDYEPATLFGRQQFDRIVLSFALSMIPDWSGALRASLRHLAPGGSLHVVDFGTQDHVPGWFAQGLRRWLEKFHVTPRDTLSAELSELAGSMDIAVRSQALYRGYAQYLVATNTLSDTPSCLTERP
ncbi:MAG: class I SAM-dependent methyltransferase [Pseudomonadota bacterium]